MEIEEMGRIKLEIVEKYEGNKKKNENAKKKLVKNEMNWKKTKTWRKFVTEGKGTWNWKMKEIRQL